MDKLSQFIVDHEDITWSSIERKLGAPKGAIRADCSRPIPAKYIKPLEALLVKYGYDVEANNESIAVVEVPVVDIIDNDWEEYTMKGTTPKKKDKFNLWQPIDLPNETKILIKKLI
jgi:hypothetical protein